MSTSTGTLWKQYNNVYVLEIESESRNKAWLDSVCRGWHKCGEGMSKKNMFVFLFQRIFDAENVLDQWKQNFNLPLYELKKSGETIAINQMAKNLEKSKPSVVTKKLRKPRVAKDKAATIASTNRVEPVVSAIADVVASVHAEVQLPQKKRGRPKGSKNKPKILPS